MAKHALLEHGGLVKEALVCLICTAVQRSKVQSSESKVQGPPPKTVVLASADCRSLVTKKVLPRSHEPIRFACNDVTTNLIG